MGNPLYSKIHFLTNAYITLLNFLNLNKSTIKYV